MRKFLRSTAFLVMALFITVFFMSCSSTTKNVQTENKSETKAQNVTITGFDDKDIVITVGELSKMNQVEKDVTAVDSAGQKTDYKVKGPLFEDVLKKYGKTQKNLNGIRLDAGDGYSVDVPDTVLKSRDIILALEINGKPLEKKNQPVRIIVPEERAMYWVRNVVKIEVLKDVQKSEASRIILIDSAAKTVPTQDYKYYENTDKAFKVQDLVSKYNSTSESGIIFVKAADKLQKTEKMDVFSKGYIKFTGEAAPVFTAPDMPVGMNVKGVLWFSYGPDVFFSASKGMEYFTKTTVDGKQGILIRDITKESMLNADTMILKAADGYSAEMTLKDMNDGILYINEKGDVCTYFKGLPKNTSIKGLLSIEAKK